MPGPPGGDDDRGHSAAGVPPQPDLGVPHLPSDHRGGIVADIFREIEGATLDRVHFFSYGDFHEIVYYVDGNDYTRYMDLQQMANLRIHEEFGKRGIEFAYPTQTLYLSRT